MRKLIGRILKGAIAFIGLFMLSWALLLFTPSLSYAHETEFEYVTVYHNQPLEEGTETVVNNAIAILKTADLFDDNVSIDLCLNDDKIYPHLHPLTWDSRFQPLAYAMFDKSILMYCKVNFDNNRTESQWAINDYELREFNLTNLLAHEFTHNLQWRENPRYFVKTTIGKLNWKLEGHAEYISREMKNDGRLKEKIEILSEELKKEHKGLPVFELQDGTLQSLPYFKYALVTQYLMEERSLDFNQICELELGLDELYDEMIEWNETDSSKKRKELG